MATACEQGKEGIAGLVEHFRSNREFFFSPDYREVQARQEFIDPFFVALGWDVRSERRVAPQYREVISEEPVEIEGHKKAPDYVFRVGQTPKFFVEAKKPGVPIKDDPLSAYQLRRYAWSAKLPLSILTDFEEFAVYDCRVRPKDSDKASIARIHYFTFEQYADRWEEIWSLFSREAVWSGSFDRFAQRMRGKRGTGEVDSEFLKEIESWREILASNMAIRNSRLTIEELNDAVQRTIDRIVFLRMAEDRGAEPYEQLRDLARGENVYARLVGELCREADKKYNSGLFDFSKDTLTPSLVADDKVLKPIISGLYFPQSPYEFSVLPVEILGNVYEQFLGKVIRLTEEHRAKVEEKPEVKKAGGVYYTPAYIVGYIVKNSVGMLIDGKNPKQMADFRVLDMACGSGSFLLGAYQYLLDHYLHWYIEHNPRRHAEAVWKHREVWRLTVAEKKRILLAHIFGVDIDRQAVEVTKLSLLLKVLEGENDETLGKQLPLSLDRALPDLDQNIRCGNSLIRPDHLRNGLIPDPDAARRVRAFSWAREFPEAMTAGGFDCVIGNPPYVRIQTMKEWAPVEVELYKEIYAAASSGNYDIYTVFVEKGLKLANKQGRLGFILPHKFFNAQYGKPLRALLARGKHLSHIVHFGDQQVFARATNYTCLLFLDKAGADKCRFVKVDDLEAWRETGEAKENIISASKITAAEWDFSVGYGKRLFECLSKMPVKLGDVAERIAQGIRTSANEIYVLDVVSESANLITAYSTKLGRKVRIERKAVSSFLQGREIKRYRILAAEKLLIVPYCIRKKDVQLIPEKELKVRFPRAYQYLRENRTCLGRREKGRFRGRNWYIYGRQQNVDLMLQPKILVPDIADRPSFALDETGQYAFTSGYGIVLKSSRAESPKYILGLLNSKLLDFYLKRISTPLHGGYFRYFTQFIKRLPIRAIDFSDRGDKARHDRMVALVERNLEWHKRLEASRDDIDREVNQRLIDSTDEAIDALVYELYGLTEKEIATVASGEPGTIE